MAQQLTNFFPWLLYKVEKLIHLSTLSALTSAEQTIVDTLNQEGVCVTSLDALGIPGSDRLLRSAYEVMETMPANLSPDPTNDWYIGNHAVQICTVELANSQPDICLWGFQKQLLRLISHYLGQPVSHLLVNLRRDIPNGLPTGTRLWHRNTQDYRMLKAIVYLNDVGPDGGAFEYIPPAFGVDYDAFPNPGRIVDREMAKVVPASAWKRCIGAAGTIVLVDPTRVFHHSSLPKTDRYALVFTFSSCPPH